MCEAESIQLNLRKQKKKIHFGANFFPHWLMSSPPLQALFFGCWIPNCSIPLGAHRPFVRNPITSLIAWPTSLVILLRGRLKTLTQKGLLAFEHPRAESLTSIILKQKQVLIQSLKSLSWKAKINKLIPTSQIITLRLTFHTFFNLDFMASTLNSFSLNSLPIKHYLFERL